MLVVTLQTTIGWCTRCFHCSGQRGFALCIWRWLLTIGVIYIVVHLYFSIFIFGLLHQQGEHLTELRRTLEAIYEVMVTNEKVDEIWFHINYIEWVLHLLNSFHSTGPLPTIDVEDIQCFLGITQRPEVEFMRPKARCNDDCFYLRMRECLLFYLHVWRSTNIYRMEEANFGPYHDMPMPLMPVNDSAKYTMGSLDIDKYCTIPVAIQCCEDYCRKDILAAPLLSECQELCANAKDIYDVWRILGIPY